MRKRWFAYVSSARSRVWLCRPTYSIAEDTSSLRRVFVRAFRKGECARKKRGDLKLLQASSQLPCAIAVREVIQSALNLISKHDRHTDQCNFLQTTTYEFHRKATYAG